ncbi:hypothetical protein [Microcystis aeruginosa]|uniref:hypothetical protein n=1 Tax=Microcystis aeruginosa TaxID=1126 RepID=UPI001193AF2C|nr:hypothetical protein [Microcystis aeruginosa]TRU03352.1 MAG: hypothetical protein EWV61_09185 [Microcystis aeruginosa Ma_AC_P_19900807_S300]
MANAIMTYIEFLLTQDQVVYENNMRPLDLAELVSLSLSVAGLLAATFTQQVIYAAVPLALNLPLSWSIRRRLEQAVSHNTSIAQFPPDSHQNFQDKFDVLNAQLNNKVEIDEFLKLNQREIELTQSFKNCNQKLLELQQLLFKELDNRDNQRVEEIEKIQEDLKRLKEAFDKSQSFVWPTTTVKPSLHKLPTDNFKYEEGLLRKYGYKVGIHGNSQSERLKVLDFIFLHQIDGIQDSEYLIKWGQPNTAKRLQKLAESIAAFTRNAKRDKSKDYRKAIQDWEADLAYLKKTYYDNRFSREFGWPRT